MGGIKSIPSAWRGDYQPADYDGCQFFCEVGSYECGNRLVIHEFPKKDEPYTETMGRRYYGFTVRGYCIQSTSGSDYRGQRDALMGRLDESRKGMLKLPLQKPKECICRQYRMTEEDRLGGYCTFDMQFVEASTLPFKPTADAGTLLRMRADELQARVLVRMAGQP